jgi:hypothetical protein
MSGEIINYLKEPQQVYIQFDLEFVPGRVGHEAVKSAISVEGCCVITHVLANWVGCNVSNGSAFKKGPRGTVVSKDFEILEDGTIISFRKHQYQSGILTHSRRAHS